MAGGDVESLSSTRRLPANGVSLVLPAITVPPAIGWPRVGNTAEFRVVASMNLLFSIPTLVACFQTQPFWSPWALALIQTMLCLTVFFTGPGAHPVYVVARVIALYLPFKPCPGAPKRFSMAICVFLLALQTILSALLPPGPSSPPVPLLILMFALISDCVFSICFACLIYSEILVRFKLLPASMYRDYQRPYSRDEVLGVYARWLPQMYRMFATPLETVVGGGEEVPAEDEPEFKIECHNGVCKMVQVAKPVPAPKPGLFASFRGMRTTGRVAPDKRPEDNLDSMWTQIVTPLAKPRSEAVSARAAPVSKRVGTANNLPAEMKDMAFIPINQTAVTLEQGVRTALTDFQIAGDSHDAHGDMSEWTNELFAKWHARFMNDLDEMEKKRAEDDEDEVGLTFKHPFFNKAMWTNQKMLADKEMLDAFTDDRSENEVQRSRSVPQLTDPAYIAGRDAMYAEFVAKNPEWNSEPVKRLRDLRPTEYPTLDKTQAVYLDYTAGGLPARSQLDALLLLLRENVLGNPHSACPASLAAAFLDKHAREAVLDFFRASRDEYDVIFTQNASNACKIVADNFVFTKDSTYLYSMDDHNSVVGIREWARGKGAKVDVVPIFRPELRMDEAILKEKLEAIKTAGPGPHLFAYPAQSNVSGVKHSLDYIKMAQDLGWIVLCDVAAYVPSSRLDLSVYKPHFAPVSFYKIFGFPTGLGCLLIRKDAYSLLERPGFMGGTVRAVTVHDGGHFWLADGHPRFEDGTVNYLNIPAVEIGLRYIDRIGIESITSLVSILTGWLIEALLSIKHPNGKQLAIIYGPHHTKMRGGTVVANFVDADGNDIHAKVIEQEANRENVNVRVGCFCNPGCSTAALGLEEWTVNPEMMFGETCLALPKGPFAMIRISIGLATNFDDVYRFYLFARSFLDPAVVRRANTAFWTRYAAPGGLC